MKLLACHIDNFGKFSDMRMNFSDGLNVVDGPNGWGKSTLAAFLKVMFYGLDNKKQPGAFDKERARYRPWQGGTFGGELDFETGGRKYRISRTFGDTEKSDVFNLYDLATNRSSHDFSKNIGTELFDLDSASFRRSIFIAQNEALGSSTDGINAKLTNLVENTNDIINYEKADKLLKDTLNHLSPNRATGSVKKRESRIAALEQELRGFSRVEQAYELLADKQHEQVVAFEELSLRRKMFTAEIQKTGEENLRLEKKQQYDRFRQELHEAEEKCRRFAIQFPGGIPSEQEIDTFIQTSEQIREMDATIRSMSEEEGGDRNFQKLAEEFAAGVPKEEEIYAQIGRQKVLAGAREELTALEHQMEVKIKIRSSNRENLLKEKQRQNTMEENRRKEALRKKKRTTLILDVLFWLLGASFLTSAVLVPGRGIIPDDLLSSHQQMLVLGAAGGLFLLLAVVGICIYAARMKQLKNGRPDKKKTVSDQKTEMDPEDEGQKEINELERSIEEKYNEVADMERHIELFLKKFNQSCGADEYLDALYNLANDRRDYIRIAHRRKLLQSAAETKEELEHLLGELADAYQFPGERADEVEFADIRVRVAEYNMAQEEYQHASEKLEQFETQNDMEELLRDRRHMYTLDELNEAMEKIDEQTEELRRSIAQYNKEMDQLQEQLNQQDEKMAVYEGLVKKQEEEAHRYEIAGYAQRFLQRAKENFTSRYMVPVADNFEKYYNFLCGEEKTDWQIDSQMEYSVREYGQLRKVPQLSVGYQDLIGVCMRLALVDAMYKKEKPFLVLDDPFVNLDEEKMESAKELLLQVAERYQVMYFTCHQMREP